MKRTLYILSLILIFFANGFAQDYTEYYFKFEINDRSELDTITQIISIDNVKDLEVFAYANQQEFAKFEKLGYKIEFLQKQISKSYTMATTVAEMSSWDRYPTYQVYRQMMKDFESNYSSICKLDSIGTTNNGHKLYVLKISDQVNTEENEPEFLYTSTMHGDETTGFILMLRLADSLLTNYKSEPKITNLVNEIEIYINPNANPDGTYYGGDNTVSAARRYNANGVDLNRNFPDPRTGPNSSYQVETQAMMDFAEEHHFVMSANFHGGIEVINYPWDTWSRRHIDDSWFINISRNYATIAQNNSPSGYLTDLNNGITNGYDWYSIDGGRQDYMNFWHQCREVTIEVSSTKLLATESLNNYWNYNKESLLNYMNECLYGIRGIVRSAERLPLDAMIWIIDHDSNDDSSMVFTDPEIGDYHRLIEAGTYDIVASSDGYISDTAKNITVTSDNIVWLNFELISKDDSISLKTSPLIIHDTLFYDQVHTQNIVISNDSSATSTVFSIEIENESENSWIELNKYSGILYGTENDTVILSINTELLYAGYFSANILLTSADSRIDTIPVFVIVKDTISVHIEPELIIDTLWGGDSYEYEIHIENNGLISLNYTVQIEDNESKDWIILNKQSGDLLIAESDTIYATVTTHNFGFGNFNCNIIFQKENTVNDTLAIEIYVKDTITFYVDPLAINDSIDQDTIKVYPVVIENTGKDAIEYTSLIAYLTKSDPWISLANEEGIIQAGFNDTIFVIVNSKDLEPGNNYSCTLYINEKSGKDQYIPIDIYINLIQTINLTPEITEFKLYPNPFDEELNIEFNPSGYNKIKLCMYNICGNTIFEKDIYPLNDEKNIILLNNLFNIQDLPKGIYFIHISTLNYKLTNKLIKN